MLFRGRKKLSHLLNRSFFSAISLRPPRNVPHGKIVSTASGIPAFGVVSMSVSAGGISPVP